MAFDGVTLSCLVSEWKQKLVGGRITKISQPETDELLLTIKSDDNYRLQLSASASLPLACLCQDNKPAPLTAPAFCMLLRKHLSGARILDILQPDLERVVQFQLQHLDELGDTRIKYLIVELMGKYSNIIFTDENYQIIDSIKRVNSFISSVREVLPGRNWFIPVSGEKHSLLSDDLKLLSDYLSGHASAISVALYQCFTGLSPVIAQELCFRAGVNPELPAKELDETALDALKNMLMWLKEKLQTENFTPTTYRKDGVAVEFAPITLRTYADYPEYTAEEFASMSEVVLHFYHEKDTLSRINSKSADLRRTVQTAVERTAKKLDLQRKQLADTEKKDRYRVYGELLTTYGYNAQPGSKSLTCTNYYDNEEITIPLDETLTPVQNAKKYFDKYSKLRRTGDALSEQIRSSEEELAHLQTIKTLLSYATDEADLAQIKRELTDYGYLKFHKDSSAKKVKPAKSKPYHYISRDGFELFVGKNNYQNDELTFTLASGGDWWFHAKGIPGSHVILRTGGKEVPDELFTIAGSLAAYYSSGREAGGKIEVDYLRRKDVKKPSSAKPGFVVYYTNYSMVVTPQIDTSLELLSN